MTYYSTHGLAKKLRQVIAEGYDEISEKRLRKILRREEVYIKAGENRKIEGG